MVRLSPTLALLAAAAVMLVVAVVSAQGRQGGYQLIVNPANGATALDRDFVVDAFLKKTTAWPGGETIRPADLGPRSPVRRAFSEEVLRRTVAEVKGYWQQRIFSGRDVPPPEFDTDDDVVKYVLKYEGAVGYVAPGVDLQGAHVVAIR